MVRTDDKGRRLNYGDDKKKKISISDASSDGSVMRRHEKIRKDAENIANNVVDENDFPIEWLSDNGGDGTTRFADEKLKDWIAENPRTFKAIENGLRDKGGLPSYLPPYLHRVFLDNRDLTRNMIAKRFSLFAYDDMWAGSGGQKTLDRELNKYLERSVNEIDTADSIAGYI